MNSYQLLLICLSSLLAVFVLLTVLAATMWALVAVFPEKLDKLSTSDAALLAAITATVARMVPGMRVTRVEEEK